MMAAKKYFRLEDAPEYIYLQDGKIVHESIFNKHFDGNLELLLSCVENNIVDDFYEGEIGEYIDWSMIFDDYKAAMEMKGATDAKEQTDL